MLRDGGSAVAAVSSPAGLSFGSLFEMLYCELILVLLVVVFGHDEKKGCLLQGVLSVTKRYGELNGLTPS